MSLYVCSSDTLYDGYGDEDDKTGYDDARGETTTDPIE